LSVVLPSLSSLLVFSSTFPSLSVLLTFSENRVGNCCDTCGSAVVSVVVVVVVVSSGADVFVADVGVPSVVLMGVVSTDVSEDIIELAVVSSDVASEVIE